MTATWDVPGAVGSGAEVSIIGRFTIELLVVTRLPECGPLPAVILTGSVPAENPGRLVGSSVSGVAHYRQALNPIVGLGSQLAMPDIGVSKYLDGRSTA